MQSLQKLIAQRDVPAIKAFMVEHGLRLDGNKIVPQTEDVRAELTKKVSFWEQRQKARKTLLVSTYGALLNESMRFFDERVGQSTTLTGRSIVKHMNSTINQIITDVYDYKGDAVYYADTDSVIFSSLIRTNLGIISAESLFEECAKTSIHDQNGKEYAFDPDIRVMGYDRERNLSRLMPLNYVYRHRVRKARYRITDSGGRSVEVTGDHSIMIKRDQCLYEVKPTDLRPGDVLITVSIS